MDRAPADRPRAVLSALAAGLLLASGAGAAPTPERWDVTVALRITGATGTPVAVRVALPADTPAQRITDVSVRARGMEATVVQDAPDPHVLFRGKLKGARRVAVRYAVRRARGLAAVPAVQPVVAPAADLLPYLAPTPIFQSRSLLVRDFLETRIAPRLGSASNVDLMRAIYQGTREHLGWEPSGKTLPLDVLRSGKGQRLGIERTFVTLLRAARIPARLVEGVNLSSGSAHKRVFWTEVWAQDRWWPVSASRGWIGREPRSYVAVTRDGQRLLTVEGAADAAYTIQAVAEGSPT